MSRFLEQVWLDLSRRTVLYPIEAGLLVLAIVLFVVFGKRRAPFGRFREHYEAFARRKTLSVFCVFCLGLLGHLLEINYVVPAPGFHDEFSHLLAADTFASGRLTNPPHAMRYFFESIHILVEPTYMSMYPPGQGMALAAGILLGGKAIYGVWLSVALCCASICWMLQGWTKPTWALTGGLIAVGRIGWFSYWAHSYWGGAVPAMAGALLLGAVPRLLRRPTQRTGCIFVAGALLLANTRLYEGTVMIATVILWLLLTLVRSLRGPLSGWLLKHARPAALLLVVGVGWTAFYNWTITRSPLRPPYVENRARYETYGSFTWQAPNETRVYNHEVIGRFYRETERYPEIYPYWHLQLEKPVIVWFFFLGPALTLPFIFSLGSVARPGLRLMWLLIAVVWLAHMAVWWRLQPHYAAPLTGVVYVLCADGFRRLAIWRRSRRRAGLQIKRAVLATCAAMILLRIAAPAMGMPVFQEQTMPWYSYGLGANFNRSKMEQRLTEMGGKHLILVQYSPNHSPEVEWVYNRADIDGAPVVWARFVPDRVHLQQLLNYFQDRRIWIVFPDQRPNQIFDFREHFR